MASDWEPNCSIAQLQARADLLQQIRRFFADKNVLEVETPLLCQGIGTDPHLDFFSTQYLLESQVHTYYLQTSPEFCMKRLLAAGSGCIYQISKAFRKGEIGQFHNPEFSLLEWYRIGYDLQQLMDETAELLSSLLVALKLQVEQYSYQEVFKRYTELDALEFSLPAYRQCAVNHKLEDAVLICGENHSVWLDYLFSFLVQPQLGQQSITMIYDYPACQSSLARVKPQDFRVVERVEVFVLGVELANGYHELTDADEQKQRFEKEMQLRKANNLPVSELDQRFLEALGAGLPDCSGIAIGLDRLLMLLTSKNTIDQVIAFPADRA